MKRMPCLFFPGVRLRPLSPSSPPAGLKGPSAPGSHRLIFSGSTHEKSAAPVAPVGDQLVDMGAASGCAKSRTDRKGLDGGDDFVLNLGDRRGNQKIKSATGSCASYRYPSTYFSSGRQYEHSTQSAQQRQYGLRPDPIHTSGLSRDDLPPIQASRCGLVARGFGSG